MKIEGIPEGYEAVRWGKPKRGELFLMDDGKVTDAMFDFEKEHVLIVRKIEPVLDVSKIRLKKGRIAQDENGNNYWYDAKPNAAEKHWRCEYEFGDAECLVIPWREDVPWNERIVEVGE